MSSLNAPNIRALADGELHVDPGSAPDSATSQAAVSFQQELRRRVSHAMVSTAPSAPAELVDRVRGSFGEPSPASPAAADQVVIEVIRPNDARPSRPRVSVFAIAASLALVAGAVLFGIFGPRIDHLGPSSFNQPADLSTRAAEFANQEHSRMAEEKDFPRDLQCWKSLPEAQMEIAGWLSRPGFVIVDLSDLSYEFRGACRSEFPGAQRAARIVYAKHTAPRHAMFSMWIVPDDGQFDRSALSRMEPGRVYSLKPSSRCKLSVQRCTDSQLIYFMICCDEQQLPILAARVASCVAQPAPGERPTQP